MLFRSRERTPLVGGLHDTTQHVKYVLQCVWWEDMWSWYESVLFSSLFPCLSLSLSLSLQGVGVCLGELYHWMSCVARQLREVEGHLTQLLSGTSDISAADLFLVEPQRTGKQVRVIFSPSLPSLSLMCFPPTVSMPFPLLSGVPAPPGAPQWHSGHSQSSPGHWEGPRDKVSCLNICSFCPRFSNPSWMCWNY